MTPQEQITTDLIGKVYRLLEGMKALSAKGTDIQVTHYSHSTVTSVTLDLGHKTVLRLSLDEPTRSGL